MDQLIIAYLVIAGIGLIIIDIWLRALKKKDTKLQSDEYEKLLKKAIEFEDKDRYLERKINEIVTDMNAWSVRLNSLQGLVNRKLGKVEQEEQPKDINSYPAPSFLSMG